MDIILFHEVSGMEHANSISQTIITSLIWSITNFSPNVKKFEST